MFHLLLTQYKPDGTFKASALVGSRGIPSCYRDRTAAEVNAALHQGWFRAEAGKENCTVEVLPRKEAR